MRHKKTDYVKTREKRITRDESKSSNQPKKNLQLIVMPCNTRGKKKKKKSNLYF